MGGEHDSELELFSGFCTSIPLPSVDSQHSRSKVPNAYALEANAIYSSTNALKLVGIHFPSCSVSPSIFARVRTTLELAAQKKVAQNYLHGILMTVCAESSSELTPSSA